LATVSTYTLANTSWQERGVYVLSQPTHFH